MRSTTSRYPVARPRSNRSRCRRDRHLQHPLPSPVQGWKGSVEPGPVLMRMTSRGGSPVSSGCFLDPGRSDFTGTSGPLSRFFSRGFFRPGACPAAAPGFFAATTLFVDGLPRSLFGDAFGRSALLVTLFDMFSLALLFVTIFGFGSSRHAEDNAKSVPKTKDPLSP